MASVPVVIGIDVSKETLDITILPSGQHRALPRADTEAVVAYATAAHPEAILLEATGGLDAPVVAALLAADLPVAVVNPRQVRRYAQSMGELAKTDAIDARILAEFGQTLLERGKLRLESAAAHTRDELTALVRLRQRTATDLVREQNRLARALPVTRPHIKRAIAFLTEQLRTLDGAIDQTIRQSPAWQADVDLLRSIPGIGRITGPLLIACLSELGVCNRGQIARLVGVAPINRDSGTVRGPRAIAEGRAHVRRALFMATQAAIMFNPVIRAYYHRLLADKKEKKVAIVACMRKLLCIANTIMRTRVPWSLELAYA